MSLQVVESNLTDKITALAYKRSFELNKSDFKGKVLLEVGAKTGLISLFAANLSAKHIYTMVSQSSLARFATQIASDNGFLGKITVLNGEVELQAFGHQIDVIISEWMGVCLLHCSMLNTVIWA